MNTLLADSPASVGAERVVLGAMMQDRALADRFAATLPIAAFFEPKHVTIARAVYAAAEAGDPTDPVSVMTRLGPALGSVGGAPYLQELLSAVPLSVSAGWYADRIVDAHTAREIGKLGVRAQQLATSAVDDPSTAIARIQQDLDALTVRPGEGDPVLWRDLAARGLDAVEFAAEPSALSTAVKTGLTDLDRLLGGGFHGGQLIVIAGRPGAGKSVAGRNFAQAAAFRQKLPTLLFSLEMSDMEIFMSVLSAELAIPLHKLKEGNLDDDDWTRIARFLGESENAPLWIDDSAGISLPGIRAKTAALRKRHGLGLIVIDYLQLVDAPKGENRQVAVASLSRGCKLLAKAENVPVVLLAQLNRGPEQRTEKRPQLSDLRESGAVEQDADVVIFVHRDDYYDKESPRAGEADLIVAKHRGGPTDTVTVASQLHYSRFKSMAV